MNTAVINVKMDPNTKKSLQRFAADVGLPVSALVNAQIKQMLRTGKVELTETLVPSPYLQGIIANAEADYAAGKNIRGPFKTAQAMIDDLEK